MRNAITNEPFSVRPRRKPNYSFMFFWSAYALLIMSLVYLAGFQWNPWRINVDATIARMVAGN